MKSKAKKSWIIVHNATGRKRRVTYTQMLRYLNGHRKYTFEVLGKLRMVVILTKGV